MADCPSTFINIPSNVTVIITVDTIVYVDTILNDVGMPINLIDMPTSFIS